VVTHLNPRQRSINGTSDETYEILDTVWRRREYIAGFPPGRSPVSPAPAGYHEKRREAPIKVRYGPLDPTTDDAAKKG
jgi:hypothetical protein